MKATLLVALATVFAMTPTQAQGPTSGNGTLPAAFAQKYGGSNNSIPLTWHPLRYQQVFLGSELPRARRVIGLGFRFDQLSGFTLPGVETEIEIRLGYTTKTPLTMTTSFASNDDVKSPALQLVLPRTKIQLADQMRGRRLDATKFELQIPFRIPFSWNPALKHNLLLDIRAFGHSNKSVRYPYPLDADNSTTTSRLWNIFPTASTGLLVRGQGLIVCLLDKITPRGTFARFGSACAGSGGYGGVVVPRLARSVWGNGGSIGGRIARTQQIIAAAEIGGNRVFAGHAYRTRISDFDIGARRVQFEIKVGATSRSPASMSSNFAQNATSALTTVLPKTWVDLPEIRHRNTDLGYFGVRIPWTRTFAWAPKTGEHFLLEMTRQDLMQSSYPADSASNWPGTSYLWANSTSATSGRLTPGAGHVMLLRTAGSTSPMLPRIERDGRPVIGTTMNLYVEDALARTPVILVIGASKSGWGPIKLPLALAPFGGGKCMLNVSIDTVAARVTDAYGKHRFPLSVPNVAGLAGLRWHKQWMILDRAANALGLAFSPGATLNAGSF